MPAADPPIPLEPCPTCGQPQSAGRFGAVCLTCLLHLADLDEPAANAGERELTATGPTARTFGDYELLEEIARGGMGVVYRARQRSLEREVALKLVLGAELADKETQRRLQREAHAAASLHHPNIVPVYEIGEVDQQPYFTMRLVPGGLSIADWAARDRRNHRATAAAVAQVARAVAHAHERGVLHRDLKPSNVLWDPESGPQVTDFGLAKWLDDPMSSLSHSGHILGSPSYMAPEQAAGRHAEVTTASDVYGIGALLYELLSGDPPFRAATSLETLQRAQTEPPERLTRRVPALDRDLETICLKCLEKNPAHRYATARELAEELERFGRGESVRARRVSAPVQLWRWVRRNPRLAATLFGALFFLLSGMAATTWQWRKAEAARQAAESARQGEAQARREATANVADLFAKSGFTASKEGDPSRAALWFAHAAATTNDPVRRSQNGVRWRAWRDDAAVPVRAFAAGARRFTQLSWNPTQTALVVQNRLPESASVWDVASESRWRPDLALTLARWLPRSGRLAAAHEGVLRLLEFPSGQEIARQDVPKEASQLVFSADERWVGIGGAQPLLWDTREQRLVRLPRVPDRAPPVRQTPSVAELVLLEFSRDGRHLLLSGRGWRGICALAEPEKFLYPPLDSSTASGEGFLAEGAKFVIHAPAGQVQTIETVSGRVLVSVPLPVPTAPSRMLLGDSPTPDGRYLLRGSMSLFEIATGTTLLYPWARNLFFDQDLAPDGKLLAIASTDDSVRLFRLGQSGREGELIGWHQEEATSVSFSPDQRYLATGQLGEGLVRIWRLARAPDRKEILEGSTWAQLSPDGKWLIPGGWCDLDAVRRGARVVDAETFAAAGPELSPGGILTYSAFAPDSAWVAMAVSTVEDRAAYFRGEGYGRGHVTFWDFRSGRQLGERVEMPVEPRALAVHPQGRKVAIFGAGRSLYEWDRTSGQLRELCAPTPHGGENETQKAHCLYSPDGAALVAWGRGYPPLVWNMATGQRIAVPSLENVRAWSADFSRGGTLAVATREGLTHLVRMPSGEPAAESIADANWTLFTRFDATGELLLTGGRGRVARVWDWRQRSLHAPPLLLEDEVYSGTFVPGKPYVVTGGRDGSLHFWDLRNGQEVRAPVQLVGLTEELYITAGGRLVVNRPLRPGSQADGIALLDLPALLAEPELPVADFVQLAELDAAATIRNATLEPLTASEWFVRWRKFRERHPGWHR